MNRKRKEKSLEKVTNAQLEEIMPAAGSKILDYANYINGYAERFDINTPRRMAYYLAFVAFVSLQFRRVAEFGNDEDFAKYDNKYGNSAKGDGAKYKGRGLLLLKGKDNYQEYNKVHRVGNVVVKPELLMKPLGAVKSSMWLWNNSLFNVYADQDDMVSIGHKLHLTHNDISMVEVYLQRALKTLQNEKDIDSHHACGDTCRVRHKKDSQRD